MPLLLTFEGRPVKRRRRTTEGLLLIFATPTRGVAGERRVVSQAEWRAHGAVRYFPSGEMPDIRALA